MAPGRGARSARCDAAARTPSVSGMSTLTTSETDSQSDVEPVVRNAEPTSEETDGTADRLVGILNDAAIAVMAGLGHDLGLFDTLAGLPPATSTQVADAA